MIHRREGIAEEMEKNVKKMAPVERPSPYEKETEHKEIYPQLPVRSQESILRIKMMEFGDDDDQNDLEEQLDDYWLERKGVYTGEKGVKGW